MTVHRSAMWFGQAVGSRERRLGAVSPPGFWWSFARVSSGAIRRTWTAIRTGIDTGGAGYSTVAQGGGAGSNPTAASASPMMAAPLEVLRP